MKASVYVSLAAALALVAGCGKSDSTTSTAGSSNTSSSASSGNPITAPVDYLDAVGKAQQRMIKTIDLSEVKHAIQMFNAGEGRNPKDLQELVDTKYLGVIPKAPYKMKIVYDATSGEVKVVNQ